MLCSVVPCRFCRYGYVWIGMDMVLIFFPPFLAPPTKFLPRGWTLEDRKKQKNNRKKQKNNTRDSNVVPHRSTNLARLCLTSLSRREAVLSQWYGRSWSRETEFTLQICNLKVIFASTWNTFGGNILHVAMRRWPPSFHSASMFIDSKPLW